MLTARRRIAAVAHAAERWHNADFPPRVRVTHALVERTGYSEPVVEYALDRLFAALNARALEGAIAGELGSVDVLDAFVERTGRPMARALAAGNVAVVASETTIGVALPPAAFALIAGCDVTVRDRGDDLFAAFAQTLAQEEPELATQAHAVIANEHDDPTWLRLLQGAAVVVAFGRAPALRALRGKLAPEAVFVPFGHRTSVAYVAREALADDATTRACADGIARDALLYDGEGCLSLHAVFVERAPGSEAFAHAVYAALERAAIEFPPGTRNLAAELFGVRERAAFRSTLRAGNEAGMSATFSGDAGRFVLLVDPARNEPPPFVPRALALYSVDGPAELAGFVLAHDLPLEAVGVAPPSVRDDILAAITATRAARIAPIGELQNPSFAAEHGGIGRITPFVRWMVRE